MPVALTGVPVHVRPGPIPVSLETNCACRHARRRPASVRAHPRRGMCWFHAEHTDMPTNAVGTECALPPLHRVFGREACLAE